MTPPPPNSVPAAPSPAARVRALAARVLTILVVAFAGFLLLGSYRGLLRDADPVALPADPRAIPATLPAALERGLPGTWTLGDSPWSVGWRPVAAGRVAERFADLGRDPAAGGASPLERQLLAWAAARGKSHRVEGAVVYELPLAGASLRVVATAPPAGRVRLAQLLLGAPGGDATIVEIAPRPPGAGGAESGGARLLEPVEGAELLARRADLSGRAVAELYRAPYDSGGWRSRLAAAGWSPAGVGPAALALTRGGVTVRGWELGAAPGQLWLFIADQPTGGDSP